MPAGSGGLAAATGAGTRTWQYGIGITGLALLAAGITGLARRRRAQRG